MKPAIRTQVDEMQEEYSAEAAIEFDPADNMTRAELAPDTDINRMVDKMTLGMQPTRQPIYGEVDFDTDLQRALIAVENVQAAYRKLPKDIRDRYPTWQAYVQAAESGDLEAYKEQRAKEQRAEKAEKEAKPEQKPAEGNGEARKE